MNKKELVDKIATMSLDELQHFQALYSGPHKRLMRHKLNIDGDYNFDRIVADAIAERLFDDLLEQSE